MTVFFFKEKTAYEMRISDWSSDVCSSDLVAVRADRRDAAAHVVGARRGEGLGQAERPPLGVVAGLHLSGSVGDGVVGLRQHRRQAGQEVLAGRRQLAARLDQLGVPHVERERGALVEAAASPLEQGVALLEDLVDLAADRKSTR